MNALIADRQQSRIERGSKQGNEEEIQRNS
jgi:hypothetical protein